MDEKRAKDLYERLQGNEVGGWKVIDNISFGKSAAILKAERDGVIAALKIFDSDLINKYGKEAQLERVCREKKLIGHNHPNLIEIYDGGECPKTGNIYIVMKYLDYKNLAIKVNCFPIEYIQSSIESIAKGCKFLEDLGLCHRDVKPENIAISEDYNDVILLDLGVIRPIGLSKLTDNTAQKIFLGTLRYSPPEFLLRDEKDTIDGWRAITFYQIGAILHDLIMMHPIFNDSSEPYARLVDAVLHTKPIISRKGIDHNLIRIANTCLLKNPEQRIDNLSWNDFMISAKINGDIKAIIERIKKRNAMSVSIRGNTLIKEDSQRYNDDFEKIVLELEKIIRDTCISNKDIFPRHKSNRIISFPSAKIILDFEMSEAHSISNAFKLIFNIRGVDFASELYEIAFQSIIISRITDSYCPNEDVSEKIYSGIFSKEIIETSLKAQLFQSIEYFQNYFE